MDTKGEVKTEESNTQSETVADLPLTQSNTELVNGGALLRDGSHGTHVAGTIGAVGDNGVG